MSVEIKVYDLMSREVKIVSLTGAEINLQASDPTPYPAEAYLEVEVS